MRDVSLELLICDTRTGGSKEGIKDVFVSGRLGVPQQGTRQQVTSFNATEIRRFKFNACLRNRNICIQEEVWDES